jgi:hypothetical protein
VALTGQGGNRNGNVGSVGSSLQPTGSAVTRAASEGFGVPRSAVDPSLALQAVRQIENMGRHVGEADR